MDTFKPRPAAFNHLKRNLTTFLPGFCQLCGTTCPHPGGSRQLPHDLCDSCYQTLPWIDCACHCCGLPLPPGSSTSLCGQCLKHPPAFNLTIAPLRYTAPLSRLITDFKYRGKLPSGQLLGELLANEVSDYYLFEPDLLIPEMIIPVPLHWQRFWRRGFNQAQELARQISKRLDIPCNHRALKRQLHTPMQQSLDRQQRQRNLRKAFVVTAPTIIKQRRIALLDDVVTTTATAREISNLLLANGAQEVHIWALARTAADD